MDSADGVMLRPALPNRENHSLHSWDTAKENNTVGNSLDCLFFTLTFFNVDKKNVLKL